MQGWEAPFVGESANVLAADLRRMYRDPHPFTSDFRYSNHASIIQSSGSGKSRLIDEVAKVIFTIPFNLRQQPDVISKRPDPFADTALADCC